MKKLILVLFLSAFCSNLAGCGLFWDNPALDAVDRCAAKGGGAFYMYRGSLEMLKIRAFNLAMFLCLTCFSLSGCSGVYDFFFAEPNKTMEEQCSKWGPKGSDAYRNCTYRWIRLMDSNLH